jgi:hypothetical protein
MSIFIKAAIVLGLVLAVLFGIRQIDQRGYDRAKAEDQAATNQLKAEAAATLASETERVRERERAMQTLLSNQNLKDATHAKTVADLSDRIRVAGGPAGRLRDPHAPGCGRGSGSAPADPATSADGGTADGAEAGGLLSVPLTELLAKALRESDAINVAYASCRADSFKVRAPQP